jgi:hypothetical protein
MFIELFIDPTLNDIFQFSLNIWIITDIYLCLAFIVRLNEMKICCTASPLSSFSFRDNKRKHKEEEKGKLIKEHEWNFIFSSLLAENKEQQRTRRKYAEKCYGINNNSQ